MIKKDFKHAAHDGWKWQMVWASTLCQGIHVHFCNHLQLLVHINTPRTLSSQEPGQLTLVKCAISFLFPKSFIWVAFSYPLLEESCLEILLRIQGIQNYSLSLLFIYVSFVWDRCWRLRNFYFLTALSIVSDFPLHAGRLQGRQRQSESTNSSLLTLWPQQ